MDDPLVCRCEILPKACILSDDKFIFKYNINELNEANEYLIEGSATHTGSITWRNFKNASFTILLLKDGVIVETVSMAGGQGSLDRTINFTRKFKAQNKFDLLTLFLKKSISSLGVFS